MNNVRPAPSSNARPLFCFTVGDMTCEHCQGRVERAALDVAGVSAARVDLAAGTLTVSGGDPQAVIQAVSEAGYPAALREACDPPACPLPDMAVNVPLPQSIPSSKPYLLRIEDMHCASCVGRVEQAIRAVPGVRSAAVNLEIGRAHV